MESQNPKLNYLNILNALCYAVNIGSNYIGATGADTGEDVGDISRNFQTIISPASWAFSIWGLIFLLQGVFVVAQFLPQYRSSVLVQKGVYVWYFLANAFQTAWVFTFRSSNILASLILIWLIWASLLGILVSQYHIKYDSSHLEHVMFKLPFSIHFGWLSAASLLNANLYVIKLEGSIALQLAFGIGSLAILHGLAVFVLFGLSKPSYVLPAVFIWAIVAISSELKEPKLSIVERFDSDTVTGIRYTAIAVSCIIAFHMLTNFALCIYSKLFMKKGGNTKNPSENTVELVKGVPVDDTV